MKARTRDTVRIRDLNDNLRRAFTGSRVMMTQGVDALEPEARSELIAAVQGFDRFGNDNDPHGEHDFGAVSVGGEKFFFKVDYYNLAMNQHSVDPADPDATIRVLTIMRADEY